MPLPDWFVESERQAYESSPKCFIAREEARIFRRMFLEVLSGLDRESEMRVSFRGNVLIVDLGHDYFDARAWGDAWPDTYRVMVSPETKLPARFMSSWVDVTLFDGQVFIGGLSLGPCEAITQDSG